MELQFVRPLHLGQTILPFRPLEPLLAIIPWDDEGLLSDGDGGLAERLDMYPGLARWMRLAEKYWNANRTNARLSLTGQLDYHNKLSRQFASGGPHRVVYAKSGMYVTAAIVNPRVVIDHMLYWHDVRTREEAQYLTGIFNSEILTQLVAPLLARGEHNPRHIDKHVFEVPIPEYSSSDSLHREIAGLGAAIELEVAGLELPSVRFERQRGLVRELVASSEAGQALGLAVEELLLRGGNLPVQIG